MQKVSVYIPVYNGAQYLDQTITSLLSQTILPSEILVVDDCSMDNSVDIVSKYPVKLIKHKVNKGLAATRNTAIRECQFDFIASVDCDCVPALDWLENCLIGFSSTEVVGVGGQLNEIVAKKAVDLWRSKNLVQHFGDQTQSVSFLSGSNTVFRKSALLAVGLYDEQYKTNFEDIAICEKISDSGGVMLYTSKAQVSHIKKDTVCSVLKTCWKFRHRTCFVNFLAFFISLCRDFVKGILLVLNGVFSFKIKLLYIDFLFFPFQAYYSLKSFLLKTTNV